VLAVDRDFRVKLVVADELGDLGLGEQGMELELAVVGGLRNRSAAKVVCVVADDVPEVGDTGSLEVHGQQVTQHEGALQQQRGDESVLHGGRRRTVGISERQTGWVELELELELELEQGQTGPGGQL